jgi:hypothetical protein
MQSQPVRISEIQTTDLIFYDPDFKDICFQFCQQRDIDCLPALTDPRKFFQRNSTGFDEKEIPPKRIVDGQMSVFDPSILEKFHNHYLLFVMANNQVTGVVHFCDYNRPAVHSYLFNLLSAYERSLRKLFILKGKDNQDMLGYYQAKIDTCSGEDKKKYKGRKNGYDKYKADNEKLTPFECFYLSDLIELANHLKVIEVQSGTCDLRNMVMHAHDLVNLDDPYRGDYIYTLASFEKFFAQVRVLQQDYKKVNNHITLLSL